MLFTGGLFERTTYGRKRTADQISSRATWVGSGAGSSIAGNRSSFDVRALLGYFAILNPEDIDAEHMAFPAIQLDPAVAPGYTSALATGKGIAKFKAGGGRILKELLEAVPDGCLAGEALAIWRRECVLKNAILGHEGHDVIHSMLIESHIESLDDLEGQSVL